MTVCVSVCVRARFRRFGVSLAAISMTLLDCVLLVLVAQQLPSTPPRMAPPDTVTLDYHGQPVSADLIDTIVADLQRETDVTAVLLHGCCLTDADLAQLVPHFARVPRLSRLDVGDNQLTSAGMGHLAPLLIAALGSNAQADAVAPPLCRLVDLRVAGNTQCGAQGLSLLAASLASNTTLTQLDLSAVAPIALNGAELALDALTRVLEVRCAPR